MERPSDEENSHMEKEELEKSAREDGRGSASIPLNKMDEEANVAPSKPWNPNDFPDGGAKAWLVVAGAFCCLAVSFGWINCIGIFQDYYQANQLKAYSPSDIAWIGSLELFVMLAGGLVVGRIYDNFGPRWLLAVGTFFHVFGLMMTSISTKYYQILLSQGICSPIGISCLFTPATNCVITWFMKRRAFAIGIVAAGSSVGGVIFPIMLDRLVQSIGFGWAMRTCAFLILGLLICSNLTVRSRFGPRQTAFSVAALLRPLTEVSFLLTTAASFIFFLGLFLPINYIQFQALMYGMDPSLANYLIPILNGASLFGRLLPGYIADKVGRYNTIIIMAFLTSLFTLALWIPAKGNTPLIVFAAIYGFCSGAFVSLLPAIIAQISDIKEIGLRTGLEFAILSIPALVSNPIGGAFIDLENGKFRDLQIWTGVVLLAGSFLYVAARTSLVGLRIAVKV